MTGNTSPGANSRKPASGIATPTTTPISTSVGASTPRYRWARATSNTTAAAAHLPRCRQRPSGTSAYKIPSRVTTSAAILSDGSAHASHPVRNTTPNGRGRCASGAAMYWMITPCMIQAASTISS